MTGRRGLTWAWVSKDVDDDRSIQREGARDCASLSWINPCCRRTLPAPTPLPADQHRGLSGDFIDLQQPP